MEVTAKRFRLFLFIMLCSILIYTYSHLSWRDIANIIKLLQQHLLMVFLSMGMATLVGLTVGILLSRRAFKKYKRITMYIVGLGQTVPSLAVLALTMSFLGIGLKPAIFALTIYTILPIASNTLAGIDAVSDELVDAARGLGLGPTSILWEVELPNALSVILAGIRIALVINIGTAALGSLVGAGGLGEQIFTGISFLDPWIMLSGALPTALLALVGDYSLRGLESLLLSVGLREEQRQK